MNLFTSLYESNGIWNLCRYSGTVHCTLKIDRSMEMCEGHSRLNRQ